MSGRVIKEIANGAKKISIILAEEVQDKGFIRLRGSIDPAVIAQTADRVASAFNGQTLMTTSQKSRADKIIITSMPHPSPEDPEDHSTIYVKDSTGKNICVGHVTTDTSKQQPAR